MQLIKPDINIDFMGKQKFAFILSAILLIISISSLIIHRGPNYGIDFVGGTLIQIKFSETAPIEKIREALVNIGIKEASVQNVGHVQDNEYLIRTAGSEMTNSGLSQSLTEAIKAATGVAPEIRRMEVVGPQVGDDLKNKALLALFYSILFMMIYISARFENKLLLSALTAGAIMTVVYFLSVFNAGIGILILAALVVSLLVFWVFKLKYAIGAVIALIHDVMMIIGVFSVLNLEFSIQVNAALLTIIGFSVNDTIVIFDRARENIKKADPSESLSNIFNKSINETLSRTILTSGTVLIVVLALFFLGGEIIHNFAFAMLIGIISGTYSTVYIASPIVLAVEKK
ncbi:MAG: protein translocase subunit SecF [Desulfobacula sp.]|jgi:preprotein translocase subunit SecF